MLQHAQNVSVDSLLLKAVFAKVILLFTLNNQFLSSKRVQSIVIHVQTLPHALDVQMGSIFIRFSAMRPVLP